MDIKKNISVVWTHKCGLCWANNITIFTILVLIPGWLLFSSQFNFFTKIAKIFDPNVHWFLGFTFIILFKVIAQSTVNILKALQFLENVLLKPSNLPNTLEKVTRGRGRGNSTRTKRDIEEEAQNGLNFKLLSLQCIFYWKTINQKLVELYAGLWANQYRLIKDKTKYFNL